MISNTEFSHTRLKAIVQPHKSKVLTRKAYALPQASTGKATSLLMTFKDDVKPEL